MATDEASGQSLFIKNSSNKVLPIIRESMPPSNVGNLAILDFLRFASICLDGYPWEKWYCELDTT